MAVAALAAANLEGILITHWSEMVRATATYMRALRVRARPVKVTKSIKVYHGECDDGLRCDVFSRCQCLAGMVNIRARGTIFCVQNSRVIPNTRVKK